MTRADRFILLAATIAAAVLLAMFLLTFSRAAAAQCGCPAPGEPPTVPQPLPALQPGGGYVFLAWVGR